MNIIILLILILILGLGHQGGLSGATCSHCQQTEKGFLGDRTKWYWTKWHGQNGTDKMVATFIDSNSTELNFYSVITSHK